MVHSEASNVVLHIIAIRKKNSSVSVDLKQEALTVNVHIPCLYADSCHLKKNKNSTDRTAGLRYKKLARRTSQIKQDPAKPSF